ncbi:MAG TPA: anthrone oxygenase family protein [Paracoccaceae bacterium]|nr:anthrone oxygenase family protein [Paracoccaceae bacterium]
MIQNLVTILAFLAALGSGLVAGIFFAFSSFVMAALGRLPAPQGIAAMQSINVTVMNPWFGAAFFGTAALCLALAVLALLRWQAPESPWLLAGAALYLLGVILVTLRCNVPLNETLAPMQPDSAEATAFWQRYLANWTAWNHVRSAAPLAATAAFLLALR